MRIIAILVLLLIFIYGCGKHAIHYEETKFPVGKKLYISKCGGCHNLYLRNEFTPEQWDTIVVFMRKKAKTSLEQEEEILKFLKEK